MSYKWQQKDWREFRLNERQTKVLRRMLDGGPSDFECGLSAKKYMSVNGASKATATGDLHDLADQGVLVSSGGGRSTRYKVNV
jgi:Fic family protein